MSSPDVMIRTHVPPEGMDAAWAAGWRHFGPCFFRTRWLQQGPMIQEIMPLRYPLGGWVPSKSQRRILRRNQDLVCRIGPTRVSDEERDLFLRHRTRFREDVPEALDDFLGTQPDGQPCPNITLSLHLGSRMVAASYLDLGMESVSSIYGTFDPEESKRSLGTATLLMELIWATRQGFRWHYPGYATHGPSLYDYKKSLAPYEWLAWEGGWIAPKD